LRQFKPDAIEAPANAMPGLGPGLALLHPGRAAAPSAALKNRLSKCLNALAPKVRHWFARPQPL
jgi:hypothetical protein